MYPSLRFTLKRENSVLILPEIKIGEDNFSSHDWLNRAGMAHQLTELVDRYCNPLVIVLDGHWGSGKSYFLKLWVGEHKKQNGKANVIYFDAFKHDYLDEPLASLIIRLDEAVGETGDTEEIKKLAMSLIVGIAKTSLSTATAGISDAVFKEFEINNKSLWEIEEKRIQSMDEFKLALAKIAEKETLVFIVDELDRCRPDYALKLIEIIKHFFEVPNVHFVLGANLKSLENSVKATYGEGIDAGKYLQKFYTITMQFLPVTSNISPNTAFQYYHALKKKLEPLIPIDTAFNKNISDLLKLHEIYNKLSLRDIERLFYRLSLFPSQKIQHRFDFSDVIAFAAVLEAYDINKFYAFLRGELDIHDIDTLLKTSANEPMDNSVPTTKDILIKRLKVKCILLNDSSGRYSYSLYQIHYINETFLGGRYDLSDRYKGNFDVNKHRKSLELKFKLFLKRYFGTFNITSS